MPWFLFAFLSAFFESSKDVFSKRGLKIVDEYSAAFSLRFFAAPFLLLFLIIIGIPKLGEQFFTVLLIGGSLNVLTTVFYMKALKNSDLSIVTPIVSFTPVFVLITSPFILNEFPSTMGLIGVLLIVSGSYFLNIGERSKGFFAPIKALFVEKGARFMFVVAFIWSITSNLDKIGVKNSSPVFWAFSQTAFIAIVLLPLIIRRSQKVKEINNNLKALIPIGLFSALLLFFQMTAINLAPVSYVTSLKRTSVLITVLLGYFIFKEKNIKERILGALIMVLGILFITLS